MLVAPGIPALREAVTEDDKRTHTLLSDVHAHTIRLDNAMLYLAHHDLQGGLYPTCLTSSPYCDSTTFLPKDTAYGGSSQGVHYIFAHQQLRNRIKLQPEGASSHNNPGDAFWYCATKAPQRRHA